MGSKNHEVVPTPLIVQLSGLRSHSSGPAHRAISVLAKAGLIAKVKNARYDGYRLTYGGLDYLALHSHTKSSAIVHLGNQMGVGKESDIHLITSLVPARTAISLTPSSHPTSEEGGQAVEQAILKIHRLGRTSFRTLKNNRAYQGNRAHCSWQYLSRLSAQKEYAAMQSLYAAGFPVPRPVAHNRHTVVMSLVPGIPLRQVGPEDLAAAPPTIRLLGAVGNDNGDELVEDTSTVLADETRTAALYSDVMELTLKLAEAGLIHGDFNEFNILIESPYLTSVFSSLPLPADTPTHMIPHLIDFPQITSLLHPSAQEYFNRDVECIKTYFRKRYRFQSEDPGPTFEEAVARRRKAVATGKWVKGLDIEIEAAGFSRKMGKELEEAIEAARGIDDDTHEDERASDDDDEEEQILYEVPSVPLEIQDSGNTDVKTDSESMSKCIPVPLALYNHDEPGGLTALNTELVIPFTVNRALSSSSGTMSMTSRQSKVRSGTKAASGWVI